MRGENTDDDIRSESVDRSDANGIIFDKD